MVKKIVITSLCMALGSSLYGSESSENEVFIGLEVGAATIQADANTALFRELNYEGSDAEYGFRIGVQNDSWRTMFAFDYFDSKDDNQNYEKGLFGIDYFLFTSGSEDISFKPYIGAHIGYMNYESDGIGFDEAISENGFLYGGQIGFTVGLMDSLDLDLMYRYSLTDVAYTDHIESFVVGINYIY